MSIRITLSDFDRKVLGMALKYIMEDGGSYRNSGKIGKEVVMELAQRCGIDLVPTTEPEATP